MWLVAGVTPSHAAIMAAGTSGTNGTAAGHSVGGTAAGAQRRGHSGGGTAAGARRHGTAAAGAENGTSGQLRPQRPPYIHTFTKHRARRAGGRPLRPIGDQ